MSLPQPDAGYALPELLQICTLKELHFFFNLSHSLFSYNFSSISSIGKDLSDITRLGDQSSPPFPEGFQIRTDALGQYLLAVHTADASATTL